MTLTLPKAQRYRGYVLTSIGLQKLQVRIQQLERQTRLRQSPKTIAERVQLSDPDGIHPMTVRRILRGQEGVDQRSINRLFQALQLQLEAGDHVHAGLCEDCDRSNLTKHNPEFLTASARSIEDSEFYGRTDELAQLHQKIVVEGCRVVALLGMVGIGKTALSTALAERLKPEFAAVVWKSVRYAPTIKVLLVDILQTLGEQLKGQPEEAPADALSKLKITLELPISTPELISLLIEQLKRHRCLLILDGVETILFAHYFAGSGYEAYSELFQFMAEVRHQSCLVITSQEKPKAISILDSKVVYSFQLSGLKLPEVQHIFRQRGDFRGSPDHWQTLVEHYAGNPLALKITSSRILEYFNGDICEYLKEVKQNSGLSLDLRNLFERSFNRLSEPELIVMRQLATYSNWTGLSQLRQDLAALVNQWNFLEVLDSLSRRSLLEKSGCSFKLQPIIAEYVSELPTLERQTSQKLRLLSKDANVSTHSLNCSLRDVSYQA